MTRGEIFLVVALFLLVYAAGFLKRGGDALERLFSAARGDDDGPASASAIASSGVAKEGGPLAAARPPGTAPGGEETASTHADAEREGARKKDPPSP